MSLDDELALFEQEIANITAVTEEKPESSAIKNGDSSSINVVSKVEQTKPSASFIPTQLKQKYESSAIISEAPTLYNTVKTAKSGSRSAATIEKPPEPPQTPLLQPLPADVELVAAKRSLATAYENSYIGQVMRGEKKMKRFVRVAGGQKWEDASLAEWDPNDFRIFCGDLGNEVSDELLAKAFRKYPSFQKAKVVRDARTNKSKGYGFVSFRLQDDFVRAMREMDGKYVGNRPIKLRKSNWKDRSVEVVKKKTKQKQKLGLI
uniref:RNA-binding protein 42 n=1 Tax=Panagrolaimus sp. JU765 TaxID=591449 RepID=A0AC34QQR4_9BILA